MSLVHMQNPLHKPLIALRMAATKTGAGKRQSVKRNRGIWPLSGMIAS
jgi:hypothetical protein